MEPGEYLIPDGNVRANEGRTTRTLEVKNTGDRPIQVGSHTHFFEANKALLFTREQAYGYHLNIPAGTSIRFEPGDARVVDIVRYGGSRVVYGFGGLVHGNLDERMQNALEAARQRGYGGA